MMHGQRYARPLVTFPAAESHHPLAGTKIYCLVNRGTSYLAVYQLEVKPATLWSPAQHVAAAPPSY